MKPIYAAALLLCVGPVAFAQSEDSTYYETTDTLAKECRTAIRTSDALKTSTAPDMIEGMACIGYVKGVLDAFEAARKWDWTPKAESVCVPADVKGDQAVRVFLKYADNHPEELNKAAPAVLWSAMHGAFPCTTK